MAVWFSLTSVVWFTHTVTGETVSFIINNNISIISAEHQTQVLVLAKRLLYHWDVPPLLRISFKVCILLSYMYINLPLFTCGSIFRVLLSLFNCKEYECEILFWDRAISFWIYTQKWNFLDFMLSIFKFLVIFSINTSNSYNSKKHSNFFKS